MRHGHDWIWLNRIRCIFMVHNVIFATFTLQTNTQKIMITIGVIQWRMMQKLKRWFFGRCEWSGSKFLDCIYCYCRFKKNRETTHKQCYYVLRIYVWKMTWKMFKLEEKRMKRKQNYNSSAIKMLKVFAVLQLFCVILHILPCILKYFTGRK